MSKEVRSGSKRSESLHVQFSLAGLAVFIVALVSGSGLLAYALTRPVSGLDGGKDSRNVLQSSTPDAAPVVIPPWGELVAYDTQMERPEEYTALEITRIEKPQWVFPGQVASQVRQLMLQSGFSEAQVEQALAPQCVSNSASGIIVTPPDALVFGLSPEVRARFYAELSKDAANHYMRFPFCFPGNAFDEIAASGRIEGETLAWTRQLLYRRGDAFLLSDFEALMNRVTHEAERMRLVKALSARSAVLARLRIRPETDVDKLLGYWAWAPGVRSTNLRPLLESIQRLQDGGTVSLLYFLPQFARERLYTYPLPSQPGDPAMDCHWSTMNFFNETPDNRFANPEYTVKYLTTHYYTVAKPTRYGDRIFILDDRGNAIHSGVYIADDIIFTKNGNNYMEPWMLMRMKNLMSIYSVLGTPRMLVYRSKDS